MRAPELLGPRHGDVDVGASRITVVGKGTGLRQAVPASIDAFVWLAPYLAEDPPPQRRRPLTYHVARAVLEGLIP